MHLGCCQQKSDLFVNKVLISFEPDSYRHSDEAIIIRTNKQETSETCSRSLKLTNQTPPKEISIFLGIYLVPHAFTVNSRA